MHCSIPALTARHNAESLCGLLSRSNSKDFDADVRFCFETHSEISPITHTQLFLGMLLKSQSLILPVYYDLYTLYGHYESRYMSNYTQLYCVVRHLFNAINEVSSTISTILSKNRSLLFSRLEGFTGITSSLHNAIDCLVVSSCDDASFKTHDWKSRNLDHSLVLLSHLTSILHKHSSSLLHENRTSGQGVVLHVRNTMKALFLLKSSMWSMVKTFTNSPLQWKVRNFISNKTAVISSLSYLVDSNTPNTYRNKMVIMLDLYASQTLRLMEGLLPEEYLGREGYIVYKRVALCSLNIARNTARSYASEGETTTAQNEMNNIFFARINTFECIALLDSIDFRKNLKVPLRSKSIRALNDLLPNIRANTENALKMLFERVFDDHELSSPECKEVRDLVSVLMYSTDCSINNLLTLYPALILQFNELNQVLIRIQRILDRLNVERELMAENWLREDVFPYEIPASRTLRRDLVLVGSRIDSRTLRQLVQIGEESKEQLLREKGDSVAMEDETIDVSESISEARTSAENGTSSIIEAGGTTSRKDTTENSNRSFSSFSIAELTKSTVQPEPSLSSSFGTNVEISLGMNLYEGNFHYAQNSVVADSTTFQTTQDGYYSAPGPSTYNSPGLRMPLNSSSMVISDDERSPNTRILREVHITSACHSSDVQQELHR